MSDFQNDFPNEFVIYSEWTPVHSDLVLEKIIIFKQ